MIDVRAAAGEGRLDGGGSVDIFVEVQADGIAARVVDIAGQGVGGAWTIAARETLSPNEIERRNAVQRDIALGLEACARDVDVEHAAGDGKIGLDVGN